VPSTEMKLRLGDGPARKDRTMIKGKRNRRLAACPKKREDSGSLTREGDGERRSLCQARSRKRDGGEKRDPAGEEQESEPSREIA